MLVLDIGIFCLEFKKKKTTILQTLLTYFLLRIVVHLPSEDVISLIVSTESSGDAVRPWAFVSSAEKLLLVLMPQEWPRRRQLN